MSEHQMMPCSKQWINTEDIEKNKKEPLAILLTSRSLPGAK